MDLDENGVGLERPKCKLQLHHLVDLEPETIWPNAQSLSFLFLKWAWSLCLPDSIK